MKALAYFSAHDLNHFSIKEMNVPVPLVLENDVLVKVKAISINPIDYKIRSTRSAEGGRPIILGWDACGVIEKVGSSVKDFKENDEVFYAGNLLKDGCNATYQAIDYRLIAKKPTALSFSQAASLPLTALTTWEALIERSYFQYQEKSKVLIIGGAGGVGSMAIQLLKALTPAFIIATASRPETQQWCQKMGADLIIDHSKDLVAQLMEHELQDIDLIFSTNHSQRYLEIIPTLLRPFGHFCLIDDPKTLDIVSFKRKSLSIHWEMMFTKSLYNYDLRSQGEILTQIAQLVDAGKIQSTEHLVLEGLTAENLKIAHTKLESKGSIGKIVITV